MKLTIEFTPGSDFQRRVGREALEVFSKGFKDFYENNHKKNEVKIELEDNNKDE